MGIGHTFAEAFLRALARAGCRRRDAVARAQRGCIHPFFQRELDQIREALEDIGDIESLVASDWLRLKRQGLWDRRASPHPVHPRLQYVSGGASGFGPAFYGRGVDSCAGEVEAASTTTTRPGVADEAAPPRLIAAVSRFRPQSDRPGHRVRPLLLRPRCDDVPRARLRGVMANCNPETVSTDYDTSDRLYFEPLDTESCWRSASGRPR